MCWNPDKSLFLSHGYAIHQCSFLSQHWIIWSAGFFPDKTWSISPRCKKRLEFYVLTKSVNCPQNERDNIRCKKLFSKNEIDSSRGWKLWDPFNGKEWFLLYSYCEMSAPFHFVVFLRSFLIGEALLPLYAVKKIFKHFNNIYQLSTACYCSLH